MGRDASRAEMQKKLMADWRRLTYQTWVEACIRLKSQLFDEDRTQYQFILSYVHEMYKRGHKVDITLREDKMFRVVIVYKPDIHVLREFADHGINLDGTFMKHKYGGVLLKDQAWNLAKSLTVASFKRRASELKKKNAKALQWLLDADKFKWAAAYSISPRIGTMTSNNMKSVNKVLLEAREKTLLDCLMAVEKYIGIKRVEFFAKSASWGKLTAYATKEFERKRFVSVVDKIQIIPSCLSSFVVKVRKDRELPVEYSVDLAAVAGGFGLNAFA
ncbi:hypothetical protein ABG067_006327 [Albugo candida]